MAVASTNHLKVAKAEIRANFKVLDYLPQELRREICFAARIYDAVTVDGLYRQAIKDIGVKAAMRWIIASIQGMDDRELFDYAHKYLLKYKQPLPHFAAGATIIRYRPPVERRNAKRIRKIPLNVQAAWRSSERLMPHEGIDEFAPLALPVDTALAGRFGGLDLSVA